MCLYIFKLKQCKNPINVYILLSPAAVVYRGVLFLYDYII